MSALSRSERAVLAYLVEHAGRKVDADELRKELGLPMPWLAAGRLCAMGYPLRTFSKIQLVASRDGLAEVHTSTFMVSPADAAELRDQMVREAVAR